MRNAIGSETTIDVAISEAGRRLTFEQVEQSCGHEDKKLAWPTELQKFKSHESAAASLIKSAIRAHIPKYDCSFVAPGTNVSAMTIQGKSKLVAIVDDDDSVRGALHGMLKAVGLPALTFGSAEEFLRSGQQHHAGCLIADIRMPGISGLELQAKLNAEHCRIPTIFITAHGDAQMRMQALRAGAVEFLAKPFDEEALLETVRAALES